VSTDVAVFKSTTELDLRRAAVRPTPDELLKEIGEIFDIKKMPRRISAADVSHISGTDQVAAAIAWEEGRSVPDAAEYLLSESTSEPEVMAELTALRYADPSRWELVLIDGGAAQINAAAAALPKRSKVVLIGAVKPPGEHSEVSHFLTADGRRVEFDPTSPSMNLLQRLRDEAHEFANAVHRETRDYAHFYEMANIAPSLTEPERQMLLQSFGSSRRVAEASDGELAKVLGDERGAIAARDIEMYRDGSLPRIKPLVVPIRFQDENGAAEDLRPIISSSGKSRRIR
jgi:excinuclease ABC subunit C